MRLNDPFSEKVQPQELHRIAELRRQDLIHVSKFVIKYVGIPIFVGCILVDLTWGYLSPLYFILRAGFLFYGAALLYSYRYALIQERPLIPVIGIILYAGGFLLYAIADTGYEQSVYYHGICQLLVFLLLFPLSPKEFLGLTYSVWSAFFLLTIIVSGHGWHSLILLSGLTVNSYVGLTTFAFFVMNRTRIRLYQKTIQQIDDLNSRDEEIKRKVKDLTETKLTLEREQMTNANLQALNLLAAQVSHDIQSPLAALEMLAAHSSSTAEDEKTLLRSAASRIKDIAYLLLSRNREYFSGTDVQSESSSRDGSDSSTRICLLPTLLESILSEKRSEYRTRPNVSLRAAFTQEEFGLFVNVQPNELKRVLSNLVNNAVEAIKGSGEVILTLTKKPNEVDISVRDTGTGIPEEILPRLMQRGATFNKTQGTGLGLAHAKETILSMGGQIRIESQIGKGTTVSLTLPRAASPAWFCSELKIAKDSQIIILDDDSAIHQVWEQRFSEILEKEENIKLHHFYAPEELKQYIREKEEASREVLFLCDYEFSQTSVTGIDLIEELGIASQSIVVTSRFEEEKILERAENLDLKVLPKGMAAFVPIRLFAPQEAQ